MSINRNQAATARNSFQGDAKRVLCVCSAGLLRSPTAAHVLKAEFGHNTRAAGCEHSFALIPTTDLLVYWADEIVCMTKEHVHLIWGMHKDVLKDKKVTCLDIPDNFEYMNEELQKLILERYKERSAPWD